MTAAEDASLAEDLLADPKERAEHLMLLDLGRDDLARSCEPGSVLPRQAFSIERYSHVMHMVSDVEGRLRSGLDGFDALLKAFPAGTVIGAPKIRAMEVLCDLEEHGRGPYAGAVGYLSGFGSVDACIALRTAILKDATLHVQAGAGIVMGSRPEAEADETRQKAAALLKAADLAEGVGRANAER
jgi:anthranilate synthase component 1